MQKLSDVTWRVEQKHKAEYKTEVETASHSENILSSNISVKVRVTNWACYTLPFLLASCSVPKLALETCK